MSWRWITNKCARYCFILSADLALIPADTKPILHPSAHSSLIALLEYMATAFPSGLTGKTSLWSGPEAQYYVNARIYTNWFGSLIRRTKKHSSNLPRYNIYVVEAIPSFSVLLDEKRLLSAVRALPFHLLSADSQQTQTTSTFFLDSYQTRPALFWAWGPVFRTNLLKQLYVILFYI